ncbi:MAG: hypothetical protein LBV18_02010 [Alistipes sp.]|jgi:hypothetical protein|nr:hypothetical protein [Alistipes sp.]
MAHYDKHGEEYDSQYEADKANEFYEGPKVFSDCESSIPTEEAEYKSVFDDYSSQDTEPSPSRNYKSTAEFIRDDLNKATNLLNSGKNRDAIVLANECLNDLKHYVHPDFVALAFLIRGVAYSNEGEKETGVEDVTQAAHWGNEQAKKMLAKWGCEYKYERPKDYDMYWQKGEYDTVGKIVEERKRAETEKTRERTILWGGTIGGSLGLMFAALWIIGIFTDRTFGGLFATVLLVASSFAAYKIMKSGRKPLMLTLLIFALVGWLAAVGIIPEF